MIRLAVFGENLKYRLGGAEKSTFLLTQRLAGLPCVDVAVVSGVSPQRYDAMGHYGYASLDEIPVRKLRFRFPFLQFAVNSRVVADYFRACEADLLLANGQASPMAVNSFPGPSIYFIHDEISLNVHRTYETRPWKRAKFATRFLLELPFFLQYGRENARAMRAAALVVGNSRYTAGKAARRFGVSAVVVYPQIDVQALSRVQLPPPPERPFIMMVGDDEVKGAGTFRKIASAMPEHEFLAVGRSYSELRDRNVVFRGFAEDPVTHYRTAKIVLMPSTWEEGFGMVSVEAAALGIPTIVSNRGGLSETVPSADLVIGDYRNPAAWAECIRRVLADYDAHSRAAREHAAGFDCRLQTDNLIREIREATGIELQ
jgi:glycosyltransferase involved in cell wall biosynthesis